MAMAVLTMRAAPTLQRVAFKISGRASHSASRRSSSARRTLSSSQPAPAAEAGDDRGEARPLHALELGRGGGERADPGDQRYQVFLMTDDLRSKTGCVTGPPAGAPQHSHLGLRGDRSLIRRL